MLETHFKEFLNFLKEHKKKYNIKMIFNSHRRILKSQTVFQDHKIMQRAEF